MVWLWANVFWAYFYLCKTKKEGGTNTLGEGWGQNINGIILAISFNVFIRPWHNFSHLRCCKFKWQSCNVPVSANASSLKNRALHKSLTSRHTNLTQSLWLACKPFTFLYWGACFFFSFFSHFLTLQPYAD